MLQSLHVHNFALLEDVHVSFTAGFNVFTGETGAGKSILIDAFSVVLGGRASSDYVRSGTDGLWVQAVFDISERSSIKELLSEHGLDVDDDLFLKRQISMAGKSRAFINGVQVPLAVLKIIASKLVDIHGQHENQDLLKPDTALRLTDAFGGAALAEAFSIYRNLYYEYVEVSKKLRQLEQDNSQRDLLLDRYAWEIKEITEAKLQLGEETELENEAKILRHSERILKAVDNSYNLLNSEDAVLANMARVREQLQYAARYDERLNPLAETADSVWITLDDCRTELSEYMAASDFNIDRAAAIQERLDTIYRLQKKYGGNTQAVMNYLAETQQKFEQLKNIANTIDLVKKQAADIFVKLESAAAVLTKMREKSAAELEQQITAHIHDLAMPNGVLKIDFKALENFTATGRNVLRFYFSANIGEPLNELEKVASGGELSRIALAVKTVLLNQGEVGTMVFDEIDTGVGGITAQKMATKIAVISARHQVLCITHLPQIAAFADNHIHIEKRSIDGRTITELTVLDYNGRLQELVRMSTGATASRAAFESATELLKGAEEVKTAFSNSDMER